MQPDIKKRFDLSAKMINNVTGLTNDEMLILYGLYKQALFGNCNIDKPSVLYIKDVAKWNSWNNNKNITHSDAMIKYSDFVMKMINKYGVN